MDEWKSPQHIPKTRHQNPRDRGHMLSQTRNRPKWWERCDVAAGTVMPRTETPVQECGLEVVVALMSGTGWYHQNSTKKFSTRQPRFLFSEGHLQPTKMRCLTLQKMCSRLRDGNTLRYFVLLQEPKNTLTICQQSCEVETSNVGHTDGTPCWHAVLVKFSRGRCWRYHGAGALTETTPEAIGDFRHCKKTRTTKQTSSAKNIASRLVFSLFCPV